tara:strand:- start:49 stop:570 length:522 start_codon:yes stop_codon:yes gene_type:complete
MNLSNFIETYKTSDKICNGLLNYYKKNKEYKLKRPDILNATEVLFFNKSNNLDIGNFFKHLSICVSKYAKKYNLFNPVGTSITNKIQHYLPKTSYTTLHYERDSINVKRQLVYMLYLNTIKDKGGTEFPFQGKTFSAIKGNLLIWPADFTYPHKGIISSTEEKYIATGWFEIR